MGQKKTITVNNSNKQYQMNTRIFMKDLEKLYDIVNGENIDYKTSFAEFVFDNIIETEEKPALEEIVNQWDLKECVERYVEADEELKELYKAWDREADIYETFFKVLYEKQNQKFKEIRQGLIGMTEELYSNAISSMAEIGRTVVNGIASSVVASVHEITQHISGMFQQLAADIAEMVRNISIPTMTEERKEELIQSYKMWGMHGWTVMPHVPELGTEGCPQDIKEANRKALKYCNSKEMEELFKLLREAKGVKVSDLEEAIFNYKNKKYKSCALLLFSMIDAKLIRHQRDIDRDPKSKLRFTGAKAAEKIYNHLKEDTDIENRFMTLLFCENIFVCIATVFAKGNDFKKQPKVINRNFVNHGMITRKVIRKDCVQLFLLYYNLLMVFDIVR